ncbi:MAG: DUF1349 domain-containing protein [Nibricoccus sp.]
MFLGLLSAAAAGENDLNRLKLPAIPGELVVLNSPRELAINPDGGFFMAAAGETNLYVNPRGGKPALNAPMVLFEPGEEFILMARVSGKLQDIFDVAALVVYENERTWAKLCYENSIAKEPTIVSVVTRDVSDDCNSQTISADYAFLAVMRKGSAFSFHFSADGKIWRMVRHFQLKTEGKIKAGFAVHCFGKNGFSATFSQITFFDHAAPKIWNLPPITP